MGRVVSVLICALCTGCGLVLRPAFEPNARAVDPGASPIARAFAFLEHRQVTPAQEAAWGRDWAGNWPQYVVERSAGSLMPKVREVSPFLSTFVHHTLTLVREDTVGALGLPPDAAGRARVLRQRCVDLARRFVVHATRDGDTIYGFWPRRRWKRSGFEWLVGRLVTSRYGGAVHRGVTAPYNIPAYPPTFQAWGDADDTATIHALFADHARIDGGPAYQGRLDRLLDGWRDDGRHVRDFPSWLAPRSGLVLTWLFPASHADLVNDVDLTVNANVLYALARVGQRERISELAAVLVQAARDRRHHRASRSSKYYADRMLHAWILARAYAQGPVPELHEAVQILADELEVSAVRCRDGRAYWRGSVPERQTALALLVLLHAGRRGPLVDAGVAWLTSRQDPVDGGWAQSTFCEGPTIEGPITEWVSRSFTTAVAFEVLARHRLAADR